MRFVTVFNSSRHEPQIASRVVAHLSEIPSPVSYEKFSGHVMLLMPPIQQESPAIADKPARRESLPKLLQFGVPTTLSLTILA